MKLKSKNFKFMERTNALLKMLAAAEGITETELIENALEQIAPEQILKVINIIPKSFMIINGLFLDMILINM